MFHGSCESTKKVFLGLKGFKNQLQNDEDEKYIQTLLDILKDECMYLNITSRVDMIMFCFRYYKLGYSTETNDKLEMRPTTYSKNSLFLHHVEVHHANPRTDGSIYESYLFQKLAESGVSKLKYQDDRCKSSSRGNNCSLRSM